jgi:signal peptidase I
MRMNVRWFFSKKHRRASEVSSRVGKILRAQEDVLKPEATNAVRSAKKTLDHSLAASAPFDQVDQELDALQKAADKWLRPYPNPVARENIDVALVALVVAMALRTFFAQPMEIPTGSMQPTLYGITHEDLRGKPNAVIPGALTRYIQAAVKGVRYFQQTARTDGEIAQVNPPQQVMPMVQKQTFWLSGDPKPYTVWFPPEEFAQRADLKPGRKVHAGEDIFKLKVTAGDRLFVNRFIYNFVHPNRGDIVIFSTHGIPQLQQDTHYIKRLIGLPGDRVQIGDDRHVRINGVRLDASTPHFENVYAFNGPPRESHYSGHANYYLHPEMGKVPVPMFPDESRVLEVRPRHFLVMGDNTMNSFDSRYWGDFPEEKVVGRHAFVFWPISDRFGWGVR